MVDQVAGSELARGLTPRGASHRPDPMSTSLYSTPTLTSSVASGTGWRWGQRSTTYSLCHHSTGTVAWRGYTSSSSPAGGLPIGQVGFYPAG
jgi:hypothetical protein